MSHEVRTHTRTVKGKTVTVRQHKAADPAAEQKKRHAFEARVHRERQQAETAALRQRQTGEALYEPRKPGTRKPGTPGERKRKRGPKPARAKRNARKAHRLWRKHKVKALLFAGLALGEITAFAAWSGAGKARKTVRKIRQRRKKGRKR